MKLGWKGWLRVIILVGVAVLLASCPNPLLKEIQEAVEIVITAPEITAKFPDSEAVDIPIDTKIISITFSKPIDKDSVKAGAITVKDESGAPLSVTWEISVDTITITPSRNLDYSTTYTVTITKAVLDLDGNAIPEAFSWSFTTGLAPDTEAPENVVVLINDGDE